MFGADQVRNHAELGVVVIKVPLGEVNLEEVVVPPVHVR
jgi:hypothetical protein